MSLFGFFSLHRARGSQLKRSTSSIAKIRRTQVDGADISQTILARRVRREERYQVRRLDAVAITRVVHGVRLVAKRACNGLALEGIEPIAEVLYYVILGAGAKWKHREKARVI